MQDKTIYLWNEVKKTITPLDNIRSKINKSVASRKLSEKNRFNIRIIKAVFFR